ncbi:aminoglycoside phosphotransferase family protein [soil metagenome]
MPAEPVAEPTAARPFVDRPARDDHAAKRLAEEAALAIGSPAPRLVRTAMNAIFRGGDVALRVSHTTAPASAAYDLADALTDTGLRVTRPHASRVVLTAGSLSVTAWEWLDGALAPTSDGEWYGVGAMAATLHGLDASVVPDAYPLPSCRSFPWWDFETCLADTRGFIDDSALTGLEEAIARNAASLERASDVVGHVVAHGDIHPANVMASAAGPVLIDWDLLCSAPPEWDHAPLLSMTARWGTPKSVLVAFRAGYTSLRTDSIDPDMVAALAELRAVAATIMRVRAEGPDRRPDGEAARRLRHWRGDPGAPVWSVI